MAEHKAVSDDLCLFSTRSQHVCKVMACVQCNMHTYTYYTRHVCIILCSMHKCWPGIRADTHTHTNIHCPSIHSTSRDTACCLPPAPACPGKILLSSKECEGQWQARDYKSFPPSVDWDTVDWSSAPAIHDCPVQSALTSPVPGGKVSVAGGKVAGEGEEEGREGQSHVWCKLQLAMWCLCGI